MHPAADVYPFGTIQLLQATAGNRAVTDLITELRTRGTRPAVQRCGPAKPHCNCRAEPLDVTDVHQTQRALAVQRQAQKAKQCAAFDNGCAGLTDCAVAGFALDAGFRDKNLVTAVAVAAAETGGTMKPCLGSPTCDVGLWQINLPTWGAAKGWTQAALLDAAFNASAAFQVFQAGGWKMWSTFKNNLHAPFLKRARQAVEDLNADPYCGL
jgi:hypothetical protein